MDTEENYAIDFDYKPREVLLEDGDTLTASLFLHLTDMGLNVVKSTAPVAKYGNKMVGMNSLSLDPDADVNDLFDHLGRFLLESNASTVVVYHLSERYRYYQPVDESYRPVGEPTTTRSRILRYGVIHEDDDQ